jgi:hypothetical protein
MDEARRIIERLEHIERLRRAEAPAAALLDEVRALLRDGEAWLVAEGPRAESAAVALDRCRGRLGGVGEVRRGTTATAG